MKVLHLLVAGNVGGIELLMKNYALNSEHENIFMFIWGGGEVADEMRQQGVSTIVYDIRKRNPISLLAEIVSFCRKEHIDAVVSHHSAPFLKIILSAVKLLRPKTACFAYAHANAKDICGVQKEKGRKIRTAVHKMGFRLADGVIAISESVKMSLRDYLGVDPAKIHVIYNGVPIEKYQCQSPEKKGNRLIYVGRLTEEKGVQWTIRALNNLKQKCDFEFWIVGEGSYRSVLEEMVHEYRMEDCIHFLGKRRDVPELLSLADCFIHMPIWEEGFGITVIEAMAAGLICVCGKKGAIPEIITNGENGYVTDMEDTEAAEERLLELLSKDTYKTPYIEMREKAKERAEDFSIEHFSLQLDLFIEGKRA